MKKQCSFFVNLSMDPNPARMKPFMRHARKIGKKKNRKGKSSNSTGAAFKVEKELEDGALDTYSFGTSALASGTSFVLGPFRLFPEVHHDLFISFRSERQATAVCS